MVDQSPPAVSLPSKIDDEKFEDIVRRIDHHAYVLRTMPSDFFKTSIIAQSGTLFAVLSLIISSCGKEGSKECAKHFLAISKDFPDHIAYVVIALGFGIFLSIMGYVTCYVIAYINVKELRYQINRHLFRGKRVRRVRDSRYYHLVVPTFLFVTIVQIVILLTIVGWFARESVQIMQP